jgi:type IV pilus assembly protein PilV
MNSASLITKLNKNRSDGFAILEALIAATVFAIGILAVCSMQTGSIKANDIARGITEQSALAADQVERLIALPYNHTALNNGNYPQPNQGRYTISYSVLADDIIVGTKTIAVTVAWNQQGLQKSINILYIKPLTS